MFETLVRKNRSYRRFYEQENISRETLLKLIDYARLSPSGANRQALRYYISCDKALNERIYPGLRWAAYLKDWSGPEAGERPSAYIVVVQEERYKAVTNVDYGIAVQSILLGAAELGLGGCAIGNLDQAVLREALGIPETREILLAIALGKPKEIVVLDEIGPDGDIQYWRDGNQVHHVPKRKLADLVLN
ncbi:MAG TPA: nitroreductase family protein [Selenomonadales bacterium]|nr:nitroreductase family protein [Selenomonadales bacterium]